MAGLPFCCVTASTASTLKWRCLPSIIAAVLTVQAYKYVPFGPVDEVMPFLIRRAQENGDVLGNAGRELSMLRGELARRLMSPLPRAFAAAA